MPGQKLVDQSGQYKDVAQFTKQVFPAEILEIVKRHLNCFGQIKSSLRECAFLKQIGITMESSKAALKSRIGSMLELIRIRKKDDQSNPDTSIPEMMPSPNLGLWGLSLSGGGIRSATFNLGVIQALAKYGVLRNIDYISTVSGGGYIGSCLNSLMNSPNIATENETFPFHHEIGNEESLAMKHLRNNSRYLSSGSIIDTLRIPFLLIRGIFVNLLCLLPYIFVAILPIKWIHSSRMLEQAVIINSSPGTSVDWTQFYILTPYAILLLLVSYLLFPILARIYAWLPSRYTLYSGWSIRNQYEKAFARIGLILIIFIIIESLAPLCLLYYSCLFSQYSTCWFRGELTAWAAVAATILPYLFAYAGSEKTAKWIGILRLYLLGALGPLIILLIYLRLATWFILGQSIPYLEEMPAWGLYLAMLALYIYNWIFMDINSSSLHRFYRDKLSKAYLFNLDENKKPVHRDGQNLSEMIIEESCTPYQIINAAHNLQESKDPNLRGRNADFFIFSKQYVGNNRVGYCTTTSLEEADPCVNLGTAMAISGAAAAPNMGTLTVKPLVFIMTLLNMRLGYWLINPSKIGTGWRHAIRPKVGPLYLIREMFSMLSEKSLYINISDGGHIENLGVYELLRRKCKFIIVCDAEADPNMTFNGFATMQRLARIDMGIEIDINLNGIRKSCKKGTSTNHCAIGDIRYGPNKDDMGYLLYIKSSLSSNEKTYIKEYRSRHNTFPHETTADQFFDEAQFEVYRSLGFHIGNRLFDDSSSTFLQENGVTSEQAILWFERMKQSLAPRKENH